MGLYQQPSELAPVEYSRNEISGRHMFVTGANGFIGKHLVSALTKAGAIVTVFCRSSPRPQDERGRPIRKIIGELDDTELLRKSLDGQEVVFHLAHDYRADAETNVSMFDSLLAASVRARVDRFIHASSIVVYDGWPNEDLSEGSSTSRPGGSAYRQAKMEIEQRLMEGPLPAAILQPTIVYGPGSILWTEQFLEWLRRGDIVIPAPEGQCNGLFVDDLIQAFFRAATLPDLSRERFIISGAKPFPWSQLLRGYAHMVGRGEIQQLPAQDLQSRLGTPFMEHRRGLMPSPTAIVAAAGVSLFGRQNFERALRRVKLALSRDGKMYPDQHLIEIFSATGRCRIEHARKRLGFEPRFDLTKGLAAIASARCNS